MSEPLKPCHTCGASAMYHWNETDKVCCSASILKCPNTLLMRPIDWNRRAPTPIEEAAFEMLAKFDSMLIGDCIHPERIPPSFTTHDMLIGFIKRLRKEAGR